MKRETIIAGILLIFFLLSGLYYARTNSITSDEPTHITAGYLNLRFNDYRFNIEHPPFVKQLAALPLLFLKLNFPFAIYHNSSKNEDIVKMQDAFLFNSGNNLDIILFLSRLPDILIALLLGFFIYLCSKKLNGAWAGIVSLSLFILSPSFLGHSPLVTMDTTIACFYFITIYFLMKFFETKSNLYLSLTGVFLGVALIAKFSALVLIPVLYLLFTIYAFVAESSLRAPKGRSNLYDLKNYIFLLPLVPLVCSYKSSFKFIAPALFVFLFFSVFFRKGIIAGKVRYVCAILLIILTIAFIFIIIDYTDFKWFPLHGATKAYFKGFSSFEGHAKGGQGDAYLLGMHSGRGWWYYFPLAILLKEPFAFLIIFLLGLVSFFLKKEGIITKSLIIVPLLAYLLVSMFMNKVNIGIRHILPVYPFLYVIAGYSAIAARRFNYIKYILALLLAVLALDTLSAYPAHLSYFNRFAGGTPKGYKYLGDSNIAWGQDWKRAKVYISKYNIKNIKIYAFFTAAKNCDYYKIPWQMITDKDKVSPAPGCYIIEASALQSGGISWAGKIKPSDIIGGSLFVYNIEDRGELK